MFLRTFRNLSSRITIGTRTQMLHLSSCTPFNINYEDISDVKRVCREVYRHAVLSPTSYDVSNAISFIESQIEYYGMFLDANSLDLLRWYIDKLSRME